MSPHRLLLVVLSLWTAWHSILGQTPKDVPAALKPWETWATWNEIHRNCPTPYSDPKSHHCFWPSQLDLEVDKTGARFRLQVIAFHDSWVPLPGGVEAWPQHVKTNGTSIAVVEHDGTPSLRLPAGTHSIEGRYPWKAIPQNLRIPASLGILSLQLEGQPVEIPAWDAQGLLWLRRNGSAETSERNFLAVKLYAAMEDGIPLWWRQEVELTVSGKSREEDLGILLPEGWKLASVESPIPVTVDGAGRMKAQVRAGKWILRADAFRLDNPKEFRFPEGTRSAVAEQLVAFRAKPDFRVLEIVGPPSIDVSQTYFPSPWRDLPVYRWDTRTSLRIAERMRGMGDQKPGGLSIERTLWLDETGRGLTFQDRITGQMQQIWRLDIAEGQELGSVRSSGMGQLITRNPLNNAVGVELRARNLTVEATGRAHDPSRLSATGWRSDADSVRVTLHLPPGWRLFALFGADWVHGDWLTAWTLLDLFLLLVFTLAVYRLRGIPLALLAFAAFGLSYHEPGAPRYLWLVLLIPLALESRIPAGVGRRLLHIGKALATGGLLFVLVPFVTRQVQQALYPQLEYTASLPQPPPEDSIVVETPAAPAALRAATPNQSGEPTKIYSMDPQLARRYGLVPSSKPVAGKGSESAPTDNMLYDAKARIQTGPGLPEWTWREVGFGWNGPVQATQHVRPVLVSQGVERLLTILRTGLLLALTALLLSVGQLRRQLLSAAPVSTTLLTLLLWGFLSGSTQAAESIPDQATLDKLRERLLEVSDAYPNAADIPSVKLEIQERRIRMSAEIHTALRTAVPLPGRLPTWSPVSVKVDGQPESVLRRADGFLWVVLPAGVHQVIVEGSLASVSEWEWSYLLRPRHVQIEAPGWTYVGLKPDGSPEQQIFLAPERKSEASDPASYERLDLQSIVVVDRHLEVGLIWQVRNVVQRLSPLGKAISLRIALLPGENVLTQGQEVQNGFIEVRLGAQDKTFTWESSLAPVPKLQFSSQPKDSWVERWHLVASPVWNVTLSGLLPVFETSNAELVPVWQPWPGEGVGLTITRPEAIAGATVTVNKAIHTMNLGQRQRTSGLDLAVRCSLGEDFLLELPTGSEVTRLTHAGRAIPVRKEGSKLIIPLRPGEQVISVGWKENTPLTVRARGDAIRLPVESANIQTSMQMGQDRWVLWASGPRRGPAVRFWGILVTSLIAAAALGRVPHSPLLTLEWMLLMIGLTQVPLAAAFVVIGWFFVLRWRASSGFQNLGWLSYNTVQLLLTGLTLGAMGILLYAVGEGLLGNPKMFILGNGSTQTLLRWFQARSEALLPQCECLSVSIWWYRFLMLLWALWLAVSVLRWLGNAWKTFASGGFIRHRTKTPPSLKNEVESRQKG